ncbi:uncharacterized protein FIBRA_00317 [Fibroporia radiculosa]|uniref:Autophagy-related protein 14 n=1 Tax=Fibroporia radiculosa TaxID=599839 RepID=J7SCQ4_9APHY|nr:uncharacterized protein FIBRA_00317 [Fibroporia radiculosa]CCL98323.1 predicted protein [Fibroporia radiculosa]
MTDESALARDFCVTAFAAANELVISAREQLRLLRNALTTRRRTLAIATSTFHYQLASPHATLGLAATSSSPPLPPHSPTPPGSYPIASSPLSASPQPIRPLSHRRGSSSHSIPSHSSTPTGPSASTAIPRPGISASRPTYPSPSPSVSPSQVPRAPLSYVSTSPQTGRGSVTSPNSSPHPPLSLNRPGLAVVHPSLDGGTDALIRQVDEAKYDLAALSDTLARARSGLVQELVEVFSVVEVGGRPPLGGKAGTKGEWTIGGLVLPVPGDIRRYPPDHINAVLTHTVHFLTLLAFYLGIKLPFEIMWSRSSTPPIYGSSTGSANIKGNGLLGVGVPWIGAIKGGESGGWSRWSTKHPLHVSAASTPSTSSANATPSSSPSRPTGQGRSVSSPVAPSIDSSSRAPLSASMADSHFEELPSSATANGSSFTTALAMLLYDVCYLAHTQAVEIPLAQAGEVLGNLWAVCCSSDLGRKSHATHPPLPAPTPVSFSLDFTQLLQAIATNPARPRVRGTGGRERWSAAQIIEEDEDEWDLVDASGE